MVNLYESYTSGTAQTYANDPDEWFYQTFTVGTTGTNENFLISSVQFRFRHESGDDVGNVYFYLRAVDGDGKPTGSNLSSGVFNGSTLTTSYVWYEINMSSYELQASTKYAIVIAPTGASSTDKFYVEYDTSTYPSDYSGGWWGKSNDAGSTWTITDDAFQFKVYGNAAPTQYTETLNNDTFILDSLTFGEQVTDVSVGRKPDGSDNWVTFETPTPGASNN